MTNTTNMYLQISSQKITNVFKEMAQETVITNTNPSPLSVQETDSLRQKKKKAPLFKPESKC